MSKLTEALDVIESLPTTPKSSESDLSDLLVSELDEALEPFLRCFDKVVGLSKSRVADLKPKDFVKLWDVYISFKQNRN